MLERGLDHRSKIAVSIFAVDPASATTRKRVPGRFRHSSPLFDCKPSTGWFAHGKHKKITNKERQAIQGRRRPPTKAYIEVRRRRKEESDEVERSRSEVGAGERT